MIVAAGRLAEHAGEHEEDMRRGSFRLSPAGAEHDLAFGSDGAECLIVEASGPFWMRVFGRGLAKANSNVFGATPDLSALAVSGGMPSPTQIWALGRVIATAAARRPIEGEPRWLADALALIDQDNGRAIAEVAESLGRDRVHFTRAFGGYMGFSPAEYRTLRRAYEALMQVRDTDAPLAEVALECGYAHQSHMNRAFCALFGASPSHWRR